MTIRSIEEIEKALRAKKDRKRERQRARRRRVTRIDYQPSTKALAAIQRFAKDGMPTCSVIDYLVVQGANTIPEAGCMINEADLSLLDDPQQDT